VYRNIGEYFLCTTITLQYRPNWYTLEICINVNHHVLLVRRHLKIEMCVIYEVYEILR